MARDSAYEQFKKNKSSNLKNVRHFFEYLTISLLLNLLRIWPVRFNQFIGGIMGRIAYYTAAKDRGIAAYQLSFCFQDMTAEDQKNVIRKVFINLGKTLFESFVINRIRAEREKWIKLVNPEVVSQAAKEGKGTIMLFGHFANWELLGIVCEMLDIKGITVGSPLGNKYLEKILIKQRKSKNIQTLRRGDKMSPLTIMRNLRENGFFLLAIDQDMNVPSIFVDFFGRLASTTKNAAALAQKYGSPVISAFSCRQPDGSHVFAFELLSNSPYEKNQLEIETLTQKYTKAVEHHIIKYPDQWTWNHRRWKIQPDN